MIDSAHTILIGVDGGGTGCRVAIGTRANGILGRAEGGHANFASDPDLTIRNILLTVRAAASNAGISPDKFATATAHLGLAGVMTSQDQKAVAKAMPFAQVSVTSDQPTAIAGALGERDGFLLSVGTGTIAARSVSNVYKFVGGWGFHVSDQASGAWLGRAGLQQVLLSHDNVDVHSDLTRLLFAKFDNDPNAIATFSMSAKPGEYGAFAPDIVAAAAAGDHWGHAIMSGGAAYLLRCLDALGFAPGDSLCLTGGVGPCYSKYLPSEVLEGLTPRIGNALDGAFQLAMVNVNKTQGALT